MYYYLKSFYFMENIKNRNLWIGLVVILVVAAVLVFWSMRSALAPAPVVTAPVVSTEDTSTGSVNAGVTSATLSYSQALAKYKNERIQLDSECKANSQSQNMTFKNNASVMIDNRAPVARTVKVGSVFNVKAYGFKIVKLYSAKLPATWLVDCDNSQNVATVTIQK